MTKTEVKKIFESKIVVFEEPIGEAIMIDDFQAVPVDAFVLMFNVPATYESLKTKDAGKMGYGDFFDKCRAEGIL